MTQQDVGAALTPAGVQTQKKLILLGGGIGAALFVLSLLVAFSWYSEPEIPQFPGLTVPTPPVPTGLPTDLPGDLPTGFPTDLPSGFPTDLPSGFPTDLPTDFPDLPELPDLPGGNP